MVAVFTMKRGGAPLNPHLIGGLGLAIALGAAAMGVLLFGDPTSGAPRAVVQVPPVARIQAAEAAPPPSPRLLRGDDRGLDDPMLDVLAPPPADAVEVTLPGVRPIDEAAPVGASAELAEAASAAPEVHPLVRAPIEGLTEPGPGGLLPVVGEGGQRPADAYRRPFAGSDLPYIALVIGGLGFDAERARRAIAELPPEVTLSFSPYAANLQSWIDQARAAGHEVVIEVPMEPFDYPESDPGEHTLLSGDGAGVNIGRLEWLMSRATGYFAVANYRGEKFLTSEPALTPVLTAIAERGVDMIVDGAAPAGPLGRAGDVAGLRWAAADRPLDTRPTSEDVRSQLAQLEALALQNRAAMGFGLSYPVVIDEVIAWAAEAERRGYALAPASAVLDRKAAAE